MAIILCWQTIAWNLDRPGEFVVYQVTLNFASGYQLKVPHV